MRPALQSVNLLCTIDKQNFNSINTLHASNELCPMNQKQCQQSVNKFCTINESFLNNDGNWFPSNC